MNIEWTNADALSCEQTTKIRYIEAIEAEAAIKDLFADMPRIEFMGNRRRWREENEQYLRCLDVLRSLPTADVVEIKKEGEWEMFDLISSAYYGKRMYFKQDNGTVYSRCSSTVMHFDEAIREFISLIDDSDFPDVVERKRGKWTDRKVIEDGKAIEEWQYARCSVCGNYHTTPYMYYFNDFAYCPWCGAEMGERRTDDDRNG